MRQWPMGSRFACPDGCRDQQPLKEVRPEPVRLDLRGPGPDPALGSPGGKAMALVGSGGLGERAEERVDAEAVGQQQVGPVAVIGDPGQLRCPHAFGVGDLGEAGLRQVPARRRPPLPEAPPHREG
jgi:hypothetical protein